MQTNVALTDETGTGVVLRMDGSDLTATLTAPFGPPYTFPLSQQVKSDLLTVCDALRSAELSKARL